jgi:hypothetical protein
MNWAITGADLGYGLGPKGKLWAPEIRWGGGGGGEGVAYLGPGWLAGAWPVERRSSQTLTTEIHFGSAFRCCISISQSHYEQK